MTLTKLTLQTKNKILRQDNKKLNDEIARLNVLIDKRSEVILVQSDSIKRLSNEIEALRIENLKLNDQVSEFQKPLESKKSQNIAGWTVTKGNDGYYRAFRNIGGKTRSVYVGKRITKKIKPKLQKMDREIRSKIEPLTAAIRKSVSEISDPVLGYGV